MRHLLITIVLLVPSFNPLLAQEPVQPADPMRSALASMRRQGLSATTQIVTGIMARAPKEHFPGTAAWIVQHRAALLTIDPNKPPATWPRLDLDNLVEDLSLVARRKTLSQRNAGRHPPMPDVLGASLMKWQVEVDGGWMYSYSPYDEAAVPGDIWQLLSRLDGERTWQQALAETRAAGFTLGEGFIQELFRIGALESRTPGHTEPGLARVKLQEEGGKWRHLGMVEIERGH